MATMNTVTAVDIASYIEQNKSIYGHMQLQKLVYYCQAWSLAWTGKTLFAEEIEAWRGGPVVRDVYDAVHSGETRIHQAEIPSDIVAIIDAVWEFYGKNPGNVLSDLTHQEFPWKEAREDLPAVVNSNRPLSQTTMRRFYSRQAMRHRDASPRLPALGKKATDAEVARTARLQQHRWANVVEALASR